MLIATKTLVAIEDALQKDQGAKYRGLLRKLMPTAEDAYRTDEEPFRSHLGASLIGRECSRELWFSFHWATRKKFSGRMLRLFNRGHLEEPRMVALLMAIGCQVWQMTPDGSQYRMHGVNQHYSGSLDGVAQGIPDLPADEPFLTEFKTHNAKSFKKLREEGVLKAKWEHFVQMQQYMGAYGLKYALYCATCKDDDDIHMEIVAFDPAVYTKYYQRAETVIMSSNPPTRISANSAFYKCKFCDHADTCHNGVAPDKNCRTCQYSRPASEGKWYCDHFQVVLDKAAQQAECTKYELHHNWTK